MIEEFYFFRKGEIFKGMKNLDSKMSYKHEILMLQINELWFDLNRFKVQSFVFTFPNTVINLKTSSSLISIIFLYINTLKVNK